MDLSRAQLCTRRRFISGNASDDDDDGEFVKSLAWKWPPANKSRPANKRANFDFRLELINSFGAQTSAATTTTTTRAAPQSRVGGPVARVARLVCTTLKLRNKTTTTTADNAKANWTMAGKFCACKVCAGAAPGERAREGEASCAIKWTGHAFGRLTLASGARVCLCATTRACTNNNNKYKYKHENIKCEASSLILTRAKLCKLGSLASSGRLVHCNLRSTRKPRASSEQSLQ